jgi:periplasmic copper chaperone A
MPKLLITLAATVALFAAQAAQAHEYKQGGLTISHPWARPTAEGAPLGAAYFSIANSGPEADTLVSAASPASEKTELHQTSEGNGVMKMRAVEGGIEIKPGATQDLKPGGYHVMLIGLKKRLQEGEMVPLALTFAKAGAIEVEAKVEKKEPASAEAAPAPAHDMKGMNHSAH